MFWLASLPLLGVVALGPQVVLASFKFSFSSVEQCEPVQINFSGHGSSNHSAPTQLTILPYVDVENITLRAPIQIPIPNGASNSTGIDLSFIPIHANSRFIATLDDGQGSAKVSDVTIVGNTSSNSSCLSPNSIDPVDFYQLPQEVNQCENFTVTYNIDTSAPTITAFTPRDDSFEVKQLSVAPTQAVYVMNGQRGTQVVLLLNNTKNQAASTILMTIGGDSSSSPMCLMKPSSMDSDSNTGGKNKTTKSFALPKSAIIGIAVGAAVIVFAALLLLWHILRRRGRQRLAPSIRFNPALLNRRWPPDENEKKIDLFEQETQSTARWRLEGERVDLFGQRPPSNVISPSFTAGDYVLDPPYTNDKYRASFMTGDRSVRTSISSWNQFIPEDQRGEQIPTARRSSDSSFSSSRLSLNTVDIQPILQMARVHGDSDSGPTAYQSRTPQPSTAGTAFSVSKPAAAILVSTRRAQRTSDPPDTPDVVSVSRNNSASVAALTAVPVPYMPTSYISLGDDSDDVSGNPQTISGGNGIGDYPVPRRAFMRSDSSGYITVG
ncbi:hypothetical protein GGX14DRAFT_676739 [Mycena pura]|uniref:Mid2 domain-containing protein n=1 Tax=Mycena pura TaxID=153505 RepID=A0AAD6UYX7_9AGAR|nr:hypothetical protein GGX14DRAFT_676739 [Mycena pura]